VSDHDETRSIQEAHVVVRGRVQGVSFRWALQRYATGEGVVGWVRNLPDGSVEAVIQGPTDRVQRVVDWMRKGPPGAWVSALDEEWSEISQPASAFEIVGSIAIESEAVGTAGTSGRPRMRLWRSWQWQVR